MSSNETLSASLRLTSRYRASSTARISPSSSISKPVESRILRMALPPLAAQGSERLLLVPMDVDDLVDSRHRDERLHPRLQPADLQHALLLLQQSTDVHEAADGRAVGVGDRLHLQQQLARAALHELAH